MPRLHDGMRTGTVPRYLLRIKVARARPRAAQAFEMPGLHDVVRTGTVQRYLFPSHRMMKSTSRTLC